MVRGFDVEWPEDERICFYLHTSQIIYSVIFDCLYPTWLDGTIKRSEEVIIMRSRRWANGKVNF